MGLGHGFTEIARFRVHAINLCLLSWLPIYKLSHVLCFAHAHVVRKCSARTRCVASVGC